MSVKTVETHRQRIKEKLGLATGVELMRHAVLSQQLPMIATVPPERFTENGV